MYVPISFGYVKRLRMACWIGHYINVLLLLLLLLVFWEEWQVHYKLCSQIYYYSSLVMKQKHLLGRSDFYHHSNKSIFENSIFFGLKNIFVLYTLMKRIGYAKCNL